MISSFCATLWPVILPADPAWLRRKKMAFRCGQLVLVLAVGLTVAGRITILNNPRLGAERAAGLMAAAAGYVAWCLLGLGGVVNWMLCDRRVAPAPAFPLLSGARAVAYFAVLFGLILLATLAESRGSPSLLAWVLLLPPVSLSVLRLNWLGVVGVTLTSVALMWEIARWHHWGLPGKTVFEYFCSSLFAVVFPALALMSEKARAEVEVLMAELGEAYGKLQAYSRQTEELAVTRERNRLAREIHDSVGHCLTVAAVQIEAARSLRDRQPARAEEALGKAYALVQQGLLEIRHSVATLRANPALDQPLAESLRELVRQNLTGGLAAEMVVRGVSRPLPPPVFLALYRAAQEGLTNVRKHSHATKAMVALDFEAPGRVVLSVTDNGPGANGGPPGGTGYGLLGLRERVDQLGGSVAAGGLEPAGYQLKVEVPA